jgi:hypothetical protein
VLGSAGSHTPYLIRSSPLTSALSPRNSQNVRMPLLFSDTNHHHLRSTTTMPSTIASHFSTAPPTSQLYAPTEVQRPDDFDSTATTISTDTRYSRDDNLDWTRLVGYIATPRLSKRPKSFVWLYGKRIKKVSNGREYWLCNICHKQRPLAVEPSGHIYRSTSTTQAIAHLEVKHHINQNGLITAEPVRNSQRTIDSYSELLAERNATITSFSIATFKALLVRLFTSEQLPFHKVESRAFRDLLVYL